MSAGTQLGTSSIEMWSQSWQLRKNYASVSRQMRQSTSGKRYSLLGARRKDAAVLRNGVTQVRWVDSSSPQLSSRQSCSAAATAEALGAPTLSYSELLLLLVVVATTSSTRHDTLNPRWRLRRRRNYATTALGRPGLGDLDRADLGRAGLDRAGPCWDRAGPGPTPLSREDCRGRAWPDVCPFRALAPPPKKTTITDICPFSVRVQSLRVMM